MDSEQNLTGTKKALIEAAGELFAENGPDGTSVRAIAERARANIAAVNYHFGSKENLYTEVLRYVVLHNTAQPIPDRLSGLEERSKKGEMDSLIREMIHEMLKSYFAENEPDWHAKLLMRSMLDPSPSLNRIVDQVFRADRDALVCILRKANSSLTENDAQLMAFSLMGQLSFYVFARLPLLILLGKEKFDEGFLEEVSRHITRMVLAGLKDYKSGA